MNTCECGCGGAIEPKRHHRSRGVPKYLRGHNPNSRRPLNEGTGFILNGYRARYVDGRVKYDHRLVMEGLIGRALTRREVVHHRDHNRLNNDPSNLELTTPAQHGRGHHHEGVDSRSHVHKHFDCECGKSTGLSAEWREHNREQRARDFTHDDSGRFRHR